MDFQPALPALIAFVGIIVGWALKEWAESARGAAATKKDRRQAVYVLIRLYYQMVTIERLLEGVKDAAKDWQVFERFRQRYAERYGDRSEHFVTEIRSAIKTTSGTDPWLSLKLGSVMDGYLKFKDIKLQAVQALGSDAYITALSTLEAAFMLQIRELRGAIYWLSFRCGILNFVTTAWNFHKRDKLKATKSEAFTLMDGIFSDAINKTNETPSA